MEELKNLVKEKAGVNDEQANLAINTVITYLKERTPGVIHSQLDKIFEGQSLEDSIKQQVGDLGSEVKTRAEGLAKDLKTAFDGAFSSKKNQG
jgi:hypothetical protein